MNSERGTGRTTRQMKEAPPHSLYVWRNEYLSYASDLAKHLGRTDLVIVTPRNAERQMRHRQPCVVDHAAIDQLSPHTIAIIKFNATNGTGL